MGFNSGFKGLTYRGYANPHYLLAGKLPFEPGEYC